MAPDAEAEEGTGEKVDRLVDRLDVMLGNLGTSQTQTVIHKSNPAGFIAGFAVACCIGSVVYSYNETARLRDEMRIVVKQIQDDQRDAKAWLEVLRNKTSKLEAEKK